MNQRDFVDAYLARLRLDRPARVDALGLFALHAAHLASVPFENLDIHLGVPLDLEPDALADKILVRGRGGFCYELNGLFARLLTSLGYDVRLLGAQVWTGEEFGPPLDHLVLLVACPDDATRWLADVGFGAHSTYPLRLETDVPQQDSGGVFEITNAADADLLVTRDGEVQYRIDAHPRALRDFEAMCWYQQTSPRSHFTRSLVCTILQPDGRVTLTDRRLVTTVGDARTEEVLGDDHAVLETYASVFGIVLDRVPPRPA